MQSHTREAFWYHSTIFSCVTGFDVFSKRAATLEISPTRINGVFLAIIPAWKGQAEQD